MSIATYIKNDLAARLQSDQDLPVQLTLDSLADFYQVSFTPVRTAIAELIEEGLLKKGSNRRLTPCGQEASEGQPKETPALPLPPQPQNSLDAISDDLIRLSLKGKPVYLREEATARKYGMSRSAIRNILHQLAGSGMLDHIPRRGWRLRPFRLEDLQAFLEVRELLELKALDLARSHLEESELQRLLQINTVSASGDLPLEIDESLHTYIRNAAGNSYINDFFQRQGRYFDVLFKWEDKDQGAALEALTQHCDILQALIKKDWRSARKALSHHIRNNHPVLSNIVLSTQKEDESE